MKTNATATKPQTETTPLSLENTSITVYRARHFVGEVQGPNPVTIAGSQVATLLDWFVRAFPTGDVSLFTEPLCVGLEIEALGETCKALAETDWGEHDPATIFYGLHCHLKNLAIRLIAGAEGGFAEMATVSTTSPPAAAGVAL